jgi:hypothetical protein
MEKDKSASDIHCSALDFGKFSNYTLKTVQNTLTFQLSKQFKATKQN